MTDSVTTIQLVCYAVVVLLCVLATRLIDLIGFYYGRRALRKPLKGLAFMFVLISVWGTSIGYDIHATYSARIERRDKKIQELSAEKLPSEYAQSIAFEKQAQGDDRAASEASDRYAESAEAIPVSDSIEFVTAGGVRIGIPAARSPDRPMFRDSELNRSDTGRDRRKSRDPDAPVSELTGVQGVAQRALRER